jgi:endonuclease YncB( thermonuclease family)
VLVLLGLSLFQYVNSGAVTWPGEAGRTVTDTLTEFVGRPEAGWRRAAQAIDSVGAAREGEPVPAFDLQGRVVRVADGDTVSLLDADNTQHKVRLFGIDTPEQNQPYGRAAKKALLDLVGQRKVGVVVVTTDSYGRTVGTLYHDGVNINAAMVASGYAWWYRHFAPHERKLAVVEQQARDRRVGLWADPHPVPPWDWRRGQRKAAGQRE